VIEVDGLGPVNQVGGKPAADGSVVVEARIPMKRGSLIPPSVIRPRRE
jgi:hypothetical protein